jgi:16S rRNA (guanine(1405)-N(7))-methyltransferase
MEIDKKTLIKLISSIKKKKTLKSISNKLIKDEILKYINQNPELIKSINNKKSKNFKKIVKEIRKKLHLIYGSFQTSKKNKRGKYLKDLDIKKILSTNISTKERLEIYPNLYKKIFKITGKPKTIVDLGCGINPISFPFMNLKKINYFCYDIDKNDLDFIKKYFKLMKINGKTKILNLLKVKKDPDMIKKIPKSDVAFLFKLLDSLETKGHKLSEIIISNLNSKHVVVSFSTKTITRKIMKHPYRGWIERMLKRLNLKFKKLIFSNEIFYIIKNKN